MSLHIIKCKTILKINEIETINLTQYLNFHRRAEPGGGSQCGADSLRSSVSATRSLRLLLGRGIWSGQGEVKRSYQSCKLGIGHIWGFLFACLFVWDFFFFWPKCPKASGATQKVKPGCHLPR